MGGLCSSLEDFCRRQETDGARQRRDDDGGERRNHGTIKNVVKLS